MSANILNQTQIYQHLTSLLPGLGITLREENAESGQGGLFALKGKRFLLVNTARPPDENVDLLLNILRKENLSDVYVLPAIRDLLDRT